jgi:hypothetical protein
LLRRQVFSKISFLNTKQLALLALLPQNLSIRIQQRGEILTCFRSVVKQLLKISFDLFSSPNELQTRPKPFDSSSPPTPAASSDLRIKLRCDQRSPRL